jgi:hypothetical protein
MSGLSIHHIISMQIKFLDYNYLSTLLDHTWKKNTRIMLEILNKWNIYPSICNKINA